MNPQLPTTPARIDLDELRRRILAVRNGTAPAESVSQDELRQALEQLRADRRTKSSTPRSTPRTATPATPDTPLQAPSGGLLDRLRQIKVEE